MQLLLNMLKNNEIVCLDTETLYGFSCNAYDMEAINNILNCDNEEKTDPLTTDVKLINI